jgi:hypothetical protein
MFRKKALVEEDALDLGDGLDLFQQRLSDDEDIPCLSIEAAANSIPRMQGDIANNIRVLRIEIANWAYGWGPENLWEKRFNDELCSAREQSGQPTVDQFFTECERHVREGREILYDLKFMAAVSCDSTHDEIRDLFLQGYDMVMAVTSEVKFFEVKLDEFAPLVPMTKQSDIRYYSGM